MRRDKSHSAYGWRLSAGAAPTVVENGAGVVGPSQRQALLNPAWKRTVIESDPAKSAVVHPSAAAPCIVRAPPVHYHGVAFTISQSEYEAIEAELIQAGIWCASTCERCSGALGVAIAVPGDRRRGRDDNEQHDAVPGGARPQVAVVVPQARATQGVEVVEISDDSPSKNPSPALAAAWPPMAAAPQSVGCSAVRFSFDATCYLFQAVAHFGPSFAVIADRWLPALPVQRPAPGQHTTLAPTPAPANRMPTTFECEAWFLYAVCAVCRIRRGGIRRALDAVRSAPDENAGAGPEGAALESHHGPEEDARRTRDEAVATLEALLDLLEGHPLWHSCALRVDQLMGTAPALDRPASGSSAAAPSAAPPSVPSSALPALVAALTARDAALGSAAARIAAADVLGARRRAELNNISGRAGALLAKASAKAESDPMELLNEAALAAHTAHDLAETYRLFHHPPGAAVGALDHFVFLDLPAAGKAVPALHVDTEQLLERALAPFVVAPCAAVVQRVDAIRAAVTATAVVQRQLARLSQTIRQMEAAVAELAPLSVPADPVAPF